MVAASAQGGLQGRSTVEMVGRSWKLICTQTVKVGAAARTWPVHARELEVRARIARSRERSATRFRQPTQIRRHNGCGRRLLEFWKTAADDS